MGSVVLTDSAASCACASDFVGMPGGVGIANGEGAGAASTMATAAMAKTVVVVKSFMFVRPGFVGSEKVCVGWLNRSLMLFYEEVMMKRTLRLLYRF